MTKRKSTMADLAAELRDVYREFAPYGHSIYLNKLEFIISVAVANTHTKTDLYDMLCAVQLKDIAERVKDGEFDGEADKEGSLL